MKCFVRQYRLSGGAPKSLFQYLLILKKKGYSIYNLAVTGEKAVQESYDSAFGATVLRNDFEFLWDNKRYWSAYKELQWEYKEIFIQKPDIVIVLGAVNAAFYSQICKKLGIPLIIVIAGGDLSPTQYLIKFWDYGHVICFSEENREIIKKFCLDDRIYVIANRIFINRKFDDLKTHYNIKNTPINILIISRITEGKIESIFHFLKNIKTLTTIGEINIKVAGGGDKLEELQRNISKYMSSTINISVLGHVVNLNPEYEWAHIVVGKGRSVIEPIMMNRIGAVIGDEGECLICNKNSFANLYHYNFAGRNLVQPDETNDLYQVIQNLRSNRFSLDTIVETANLVADFYSTEYLDKKLENVLSGIRISPNKNPNKVHLSWIFLRFLAAKIRNRLRKYI